MAKVSLVLVCLIDWLIEWELFAVENCVPLFPV